MSYQNIPDNAGYNRLYTIIAKSKRSILVLLKKNSGITELEWEGWGKGGRLRMFQGLVLQPKKRLDSSFLRDIIYGK